MDRNNISFKARWTLEHHHVQPKIDQSLKNSMLETTMIHKGILSNNGNRTTEIFWNKSYSAKCFLYKYRHVKKQMNIGTGDHGQVETIQTVKITI